MAGEIGHRTPKKSLGFLVQCKRVAELVLNAVVNVEQGTEQLLVCNDDCGVAMVPTIHSLFRQLFAAPTNEVLGFVRPVVQGVVLAPRGHGGVRAQGQEGVSV